MVLKDKLVMKKVCMLLLFVIYMQYWVGISTRKKFQEIKEKLGLNTPVENKQRKGLKI